MSRTIAGAEDVELHVLCTGGLGRGRLRCARPGGRGNAGAQRVTRPGCTTSWAAPPGRPRAVTSAATASASPDGRSAPGYYTWSSPQMIVDVQGVARRSVDGLRLDRGGRTRTRACSPPSASTAGRTRPPRIEPQLWIHYSPSSDDRRRLLLPGDGGCGLHPSDSSCTTAGRYVYQGDATACIPNTCPLPCRMRQ